MTTIKSETNRTASGPHRAARDDVLHGMPCGPWGEAARTAFQLVPNESGVRFIKSGTAARFDIFHQAGSYSSIHGRSEK